MSVIDLLLIIFLFWFLLYFIFKLLQRTSLNKKLSENIEIQPLLLLLKTKRFNNYIIKTGRKRVKVFNIIGELSVVYGVALMAYAFFFLTKNLIVLLIPSGDGLFGVASPVVPILFGITFMPPIEQLIIILLVIGIAVIFHELFHGFLAASGGMKVKSTGAGLLFLIPMAFVEIDDESLKNSSFKKRTRMISAGSFINLVQAMIFFLLILSFPFSIAWGYSLETSGVLIYSLSDNSPASLAGLEVGDAIIAMNGTPIKNYQNFVKYLENTKPNQTLTLTIERNLKQFNVTIKLAESPYVKNRGFVGVSTMDYRRPISSIFPAIFQYFFFIFLLWGFTVCFSLAIFNMLPIPLFDGDKFLGEILGFIKKAKIRILIHNSLRILAFSLLVLNIYFSLLRFGFVG